MVLRVCKPRTIKEKIIHILEDRDFLCSAGSYDCLERKHVICEVVGRMPQVSLLVYPCCLLLVIYFPPLPTFAPWGWWGNSIPKRHAAEFQRCPGEWDPMWTLSTLNSFRWQCYTFFCQWKNWWALALCTSCWGIIVIIYYFRGWNDINLLFCTMHCNCACVVFPTELCVHWNLE